MSVAFFSSAAWNAATTCFWISFLLIHPRSLVDSILIYIAGHAGTYVFCERTPRYDSFADLSRRDVDLHRVQQMQLHAGVDELSLRSALCKRLHHTGTRL